MACELTALEFSAMESLLHLHYGSKAIKLDNMHHISLIAVELRRAVFQWFGEYLKVEETVQMMNKVFGAVHGQLTEQCLKAHCETLTGLGWSEIATPTDPHRNVALSAPMEELMKIVKHELLVYENTCAFLQQQQLRLPLTLRIQ